MAPKKYIWISLWFLLTAPIILWDAGYVLMRSVAFLQYLTLLICILLARVQWRAAIYAGFGAISKCLRELTM